MSVITESLNDPYKFKINGAEYYCRFVITDKPKIEDALESNSIDLTKSSIVALDIFETFFDSAVKGSITLNNPYDYIENNHFSSGSGDDYLHMELLDYQVYKNGNPKVVGSAEPQGVNYAEEKLKYSFVITSEANSISKSDRSNNFKTYQLIDINSFKLNRKVPKDISYPKSGKPTPMGDLLKEVLIDALGDSNVIDEESWSPGDHIIAEPLGEKIVSHSDAVRPAQHWRYFDLIKYLLRYNYTLTDDDIPVQTFLHYNRAKETYSLTPLDLFFKNNKNLVIEAFGVGDLTPADARQDDQGGVKGNPVDDGNVPVNKYTGLVNNTDLITPYTLYTNEFFVNYVIDTTDTFTGTLAKSIVRVEQMLQGWTDTFIKHFELVGGEPVPFVQFDNEDTTAPGGQRMSKPFGLPKFTAKHCFNIGKAQMLSNFTFFNLSLNLDNIGDTGRKPGRFIDVFKPVRDSESGADAKLLGRWFVTGVHHRFEKDQYQTVLQCVKPYVSSVIDDRKIDASLDPALDSGQRYPNPTNSIDYDPAALPGDLNIPDTMMT